MSVFSERLRAIRRARGLSQDEMAQLLGTSKQVLSRYETNQRTPKITTAAQFAERLNVPLSELIGAVGDPKLPSNAIQIDSWLQIPILGAVRGGANLLAVEEIQGYEPVPADWIVDGEEEDYFFLRTVGDSMSPRIMPGDLLLIKRQTSVDSGSLAVVIVDGEEGTVKRVAYGTDWIHLLSENPTYPPRVFQGRDVLSVFVVGRVARLVRTEI
jgi:repressor LexA